MAKAEATVEELVSMIERGELRLPEMQRRFVWRSTRVPEGSPGDAQCALLDAVQKTRLR